MPTFTMERLRDIALGMIVILNAVATVVAFGESYVGLFRWATEHGVGGFWGGVWPLMVDTVILVAEAGLFVAHHDGWKWQHKVWLWLVMFTALGVSTGGNTGHVHSTDWLSHLTAALPPVALMFTMTVGFGVMKRTFLNKKPVIGPGRKMSADELVEFSNKLERSTERSHVGTAPWIESPVLAASHAPAETPLTETPLTETHSLTLISPSETPLTETVSPPETPVISPSETPAESPDPRLSETMLNLGFTATEKSFSMPRDPRPELTLVEKRTRDMYDVDPDISVNAVSQALGVAWATAKKYLDATKEARGLPA